MTRRADVPWVVLGENGGAECLRCGGREQAPTMPITIDAWEYWSRYVMELHRDCKEETRMSVTRPHYWQMALDPDLINVLDKVYDRIEALEVALPSNADDWARLQILRVQEQIDALRQKMADVAPSAPPATTRGPVAPSSKCAHVGLMVVERTWNGVTSDLTGVRVFCPRCDASWPFGAMVQIPPAVPSPSSASSPESYCGGGRAGSHFCTLSPGHTGAHQYCGVCADKGRNACLLHAPAEVR